MDDLDILLVVVCLVVIAGLRDIIGRDEEEVDVFTVVVVVVVVVVVIEPLCSSSACRQA